MTLKDLKGHLGHITEWTDQNKPLDNAKSWLWLSQILAPFRCNEIFILYAALINYVHSPLT